MASRTFGHALTGPRIAHQTRVRKVGSGINAHLRHAKAGVLGITGRAWVRAYRHTFDIKHVSIAVPHHQAFFTWLVAPRHAAACGITFRAGVRCFAWQTFQTDQPAIVIEQGHTFEAWAAIDRHAGHSAIGCRDALRAWIRAKRFALTGGRIAWEEAWVDTVGFAMGAGAAIAHAMLADVSA